MDIKETKEVIVAANKIILVVLGALKDGFQVEDIGVIVSKLVNDNAEILAAIQNFGQVPAEIKDISIEEGIELLKIQIGFIKEYLELFKK